MSFEYNLETTCNWPSFFDLLTLAEQCVVVKYISIGFINCLGYHDTQNEL